MHNVIAIHRLHSFSTHGRTIIQSLDVTASFHCKVAIAQLYQESSERAEPKLPISTVGHNLFSTFKDTFLNFVCFIVERDREEGMGVRGEEVQQMTTGRIRTRVYVELYNLFPDY